ncbi:hypothetical protein [Pararhizobium sp. PWRC1-1]|uniref:hypothetical protein n=1 Tax=Pararhizobium sp. PWRC1-1 TaxID=2804566 RepID=UPI003CF5C5A4
MVELADHLMLGMIVDRDLDRDLAILNRGWPYPKPLTQSVFDASDVMVRGVASFSRADLLGRETCSDGEIIEAVASSWWQVVAAQWIAFQFRFLLGALSLISAASPLLLRNTM